MESRGGIGVGVQMNSGCHVKLCLISQASVKVKGVVII